MIKPNNMLPQFLHCKSPLEPATDYILFTKPPFYLGKVIQFRDSETVTDFIADKKAKDGYFLGAQVEGYNILVVYNGSLNKTDLTQQDFKYTGIYVTAINDVFNSMAAEYLNRINQREQRFKRYKI